MPRGIGAPGRGEGGVTLDPARVAALDELVGGDAEALRELVDAFLEDAPARSREIREGIAHGDAELVRRAAHTLKGNAATFGALELAETCRALEQLASGGGLDGAEELADRVEAALGRSLPAIETLPR